MKLIVKLFSVVAAVIFSAVALIKLARGCSWKEAAGILEEFTKEMRESHCCCCGTKDNQPKADVEENAEGCC